MDTETRISNLEDRVAKLEKLADDTRKRAESALSKLESHPMIGAFIRMIKD